MAQLNTLKHWYTLPELFSQVETVGDERRAIRFEDRESFEKVFSFLRYYELPTMYGIRGSMFHWRRFNVRFEEKTAGKWAFEYHYDGLRSYVHSCNPDISLHIDAIASIEVEVSTCQWIDITIHLTGGNNDTDKCDFLGICLFPCDRERINAYWGITE